MTDAASHAPAERGGGGKAVVVFLIFVIVGPPVAALMALGIIPLFERPGTPFLPARVDDFIAGFVRLVFMAYIFGGAQVMLMGLIAALWQHFRRPPRVSFLLVLLVSLAIASAVVVYFAEPFSKPAPHPGIVASVLALHVGPALVCCLIANAFLRSRQRRQELTVEP